MRLHRKAEPQEVRAFPYAGITIFILFFGASLLDAVSGARWLRVIFWLGMGVCFLVLDAGGFLSRRSR